MKLYKNILFKKNLTKFKIFYLKIRIKTTLLFQTQKIKLINMKNFNVYFVIMQEKLKTIKNKFINLIKINFQFIN